MTDLSTQRQPATPVSSLVQSLRLPLMRLKQHLRSRRQSKIDLRSANGHFLKDIGLRR